MPHSQASIDKATHMLGYKPSHDLNAGLKISVDWYWEHLSRK